MFDLPIGPWKYFDHIFVEAGKAYICENILLTNAEGYL